MLKTTRILALALTLALSVSLWGHFEAQASQNSQSPLPDAMAAQADPQEGDDPDPNLGYLFGVYIVTWAGFFGYAFVMSRRQREMQREIVALRAIIEQRREQE